MALRPTVLFLKEHSLPFLASYKLYEFGKQCPGNEQIEEQSTIY